MGINTDLNVDPYYDDFSEAKQFNRILFKPAKAVQARELTQLQTILQKQVERFGSNVYKEGTIISGINITSRPDIFYVKLNDTVGFTDPTIYNQTDAVTYTATGTTTGLVAEIILGENGFQTQDPDLKTFYINYIGFDDSTVTGASLTDAKQFAQGEQLKIKDGNGVVVESSITVATVVGHAGRSFGVSCEEGVVYQKGHFIFVDNQFIIVSKYSNIPGASSVGFTVAENLINSNKDTTLLDNAAGFNNENAPGADRLQLVPQLVTYSTASEPEEFFALVRYVGGEAVRIRDRTEFNVVGDELARRTFDESGNYVTNGLRVTLEQDGSNTNAVVAPGKAYVFGRETINVSPRKLLIEPTTLTQSKTNQYTGVQYGQYFTYNHTAGLVLDNYPINGSVVNLLDGSDNIIGTASVSNITPGKIFVYNISKTSGQENTAIAKLGSTTLTNGGTLYGVNSGGKLFNTGKGSIDSISNVAYTRRVRLPVTSSTVTIPATSNTQPLVNNSYVAMSNTDIIREANGSPLNTVDLQVIINEVDFEGFLYYDEIVTGSEADGLNDLDIYVNTTYDLTGETSGNPVFGIPNMASLGVPNAIKLLEVKNISDPSNIKDITSKFKLVNNQKDHVYDHSFITAKAGEVVNHATTLRVKVKVLKRQSVVGSGYLTANSYSTLSDKSLIKNFTGKDGIEHSLVNCFDFRPYKQAIATYALSETGASTVSLIGTAVDAGISPSNNATISSDQSYYMSRIDSVVFDEFGDLSIYKGGESESPSIPEIPGMYALSNVYVPGNVTKVTGNNPIRVVDVSNKNYTMKDISGIEKKIDRLTDAVSMSLLESSTKDMFIPNGSGTNRFKNGILVDAFRDLRVGAVEDPDFGAAIDKSRTVATPSVTQFPIDLKVDSSTGANVYQDVVTLADTGTRVNVIEQPFATNFRNCVSNFYNYAGKASIDPPFDAGYDVIENPAINLEVDIATPLLDLIDNLQEVIPLTREQVSSISGAVQRNGNNRSQTTTVTTTTDSLTVGDNNVTTSSVGNFVTDVTMSPYIQSREVKILVTGLRPNTRHYFFLDGASIDSHIYPGDVNPTVIGSATEYNVSEVEDNGSAKGSAVRTDAEGTLAAVFDIPEATFFVGERAIEIVDIDQYSSLESGKTSYTKAVYRAYNFDVGKSELTQTTRTPTFDVERNVTTRSFTRQWRVDPIAQTFIVRPAQAEGASMSMISSVDVYFKSKSATVGATLELREVVNGYPSQAVLPFGRKHLRASQINTSDAGTTATTFQFKNPVKLNVNKEYCFVVIPDANSPDFLIFTSKVGNADLATGTSITNDWGDGVLFTSTNDSAWKSYQDEDIKFTLKRYQHQATAGSVDLSPNDVEFLSVTDTTLNFKNDELAYIKKSYSKPCGVSDRTVTISGGSIFAVGDYVLIVDNNDNFLSEIVAVNDTASILTIRAPYSGTTNSATAFLTVAGRVSYFNKRKADRLFLKESSAKEGNFLVAGEVVNGYRTGATTTISTIDNEPISYFQPQIFVSNSMRTSTDFTLYKGSAVDKSIPLNGNVYSTGTLRVVNSTSNIVNPGLTESNDFKIRVAMTNNGYQSSTPIVDPALSILNAYKYKISASSVATSSWVSKEITLQEQLDATGLRVYLSGFRPAGAYIDVYARFVYPTDIETQSDWIKLVNSDEDMYSNLSNTLDYREFQYDLADETNDYSSFQLKFEMRHATSSEINDKDLNVTPAEHIFPHIYDYRAIALT